MKRTTPRSIAALARVNRLATLGPSLPRKRDRVSALLARPELFARAFTEKLLTYGLGRALSAHDMPTVRAVVRGAQADEYRFSTLVKGIVRSPAFRMSVVPELTEATSSAVPETARL